MPIYLEPNWSKGALADWQAYTLYLATSWPAKTLLAFEYKMDTALAKLTEDPMQHRIISKKKHIRRCRVDRYVSLYYTVKRNQAHILYFQHASRNPERLGL